MIKSKGTLGPLLLAFLGAVALFFFLRSPPSLSLLPSHHRLEQQPTKVSTPTPESRWDITCRQALTSTCDPFVRPGYISADAVWTPLTTDTSCHGLDYVTHATLCNYYFLRDKVITFVGDSVLRRTMMAMCASLEGNLTVLPEIEGYRVKRDEDAMHACVIPSTNTTLLTIFLYGITEFDDSDSDFLVGNQYVKHTIGEDPRIWRLETRLSSAVPYLQQNYGDPSLVIMNSGLWDLMLLQYKFLYRQFPESELSPPSYLEWYTHRTATFMNLTRSYYPEAKMVWQALHNPRTFNIGRNWGLWSLNFTELHFSATAQPRVQGLREAGNAAALEHDIEVLPLDEFMSSGVEGKSVYSDEVHPGDVPNKLVADFLIHRMRTSKIR